MKRVQVVLVSYPTATSEFWGGVFSAAWGAYVLWPWGANFHSAAYVDFIKFVPEWVWGSALLIGGIWQIVAMNRLAPTARVVGAVILMAAWSFITMFGIIADTGIVCLPFYACMAIKEFWITIRAVPPPHKDLPFAPKREADIGNG